MFGSDTNKAASCKIVLEAYQTRGENVMASDPVINDCFMYMCKILHDSIECVFVIDFFIDLANIRSSFKRHCYYISVR